MKTAIMENNKHLSWLYRILKERGIVYTMVLLVSCTSIVSVLVTVVFSWIFLGRVSLMGSTIGFLIPLFVGSPFSYMILRLTMQLEETREKLYQLSIRDELTGAYNRRYFIDQIEKEFERSRRYGSIFSVIMFDIDDFKLINDTLGHSAGDQVLQHLSQICTQHSRAVDTFVRFGGDEFVFLSPDLNAEQVIRFAERIRSLLVDQPVCYGEHEIHFTVSMGCCTRTSEISDRDTLLKCMDLALYAAKNAGKDRIVHTKDIVIT